MKIRLAVAATVVAFSLITCVSQEDAADSDCTWVGTITTEGNVTTVVNQSGSVWGGRRNWWRKPPSASKTVLMSICSGSQRPSLHLADLPPGRRPPREPRQHGARNQTSFAFERLAIALRKTQFLRTLKDELLWRKDANPG